MDRATQREILAALAHRQWSGWMQHFFSKCEVGDDGVLIVPAGYVQALERQMYAKYAQLTEAEKELDRQEADKVLAALNLTGVVE
jgi:hypothetical protein